MPDDLWTLFNAFCRLAIYISVVGAIGGIFSSVLLREFQSLRGALLRYQRTAYGLGILATSASFFIQVGSFSNNGVAGMFAGDIIRILGSTPVGFSAVFLITGFVILGFTSTLPAKFKPTSWAGTIIYVPGIIPLLLSFSVTGHLAEKPWLNHVVISVHVLVAALWLGSLYPLYKLSTDTLSTVGEVVDIGPPLVKFGRIAAWIVILLIVCGAWLSYVLIGNISALFTTDYGNALLAKLVFVAVILSLAAINKLYWVPRLQLTGVRQGLKRSIQGEIIVGIGVLVVTAYLTTIVGMSPAEH